MQELSKEHREMLGLVCIRGLRYEEVSEMLQIPVGTVRSRLSRARKQLQDLLEHREPMLAASFAKDMPAHIANSATQDFSGSRVN